MVAWAAEASTVVALVCAAILSAILLSQVCLVLLHLALRRDGVAREAALLALPPPADAALPHVVVQITVCNESAVVARAIQAAAQLDWPREKLHIQICDDSDDHTTDLARAAIAPLAQSSIDIRLLRRGTRSDFKAGNLRAAMAETGHDYFAIFDVDYVPPPDFLRKCVPPLLADPALGFVQARPDFLNANENAVTRAAALNLDAHHAIEQATRSWAGQAPQFNGTCGIWRRAAIESCGGWSGTTITEDVDLSYRAAFSGWRGLFLTSVFVRGELPATRHAWVTQQRRWKIGLGQVARRVVPRLLADWMLPPSIRFAGLLHLGTGWWAPPVGIVMFTAACIAAVLEPQRLPLFIAMQLALFTAAHVERLVYLRVGQRFVRGTAVPLRGFLVDFLHLAGLTVWLELRNLDAHWRAFVGRNETFYRTPKLGSLAHGTDARMAGESVAQ